MKNKKMIMIIRDCEANEDYDNDYDEDYNYEDDIKKFMQNMVNHHHVDVYYGVLVVVKHY